MNYQTLAIIAVLLLSGCASAIRTDYDPYVAAVDNQLQNRSEQTRQIGVSDYNRLVSAIIGTLQDYHFRIIDIDPDLGTITAYQLTRHKTELTLLIRERGEGQYSVRINMSAGLKQKGDSETYQQFFTALNKKLHYQSKA